mgnify:CR=1 FL=1
MKKSLIFSLIMLSLILQGSGYKGTLPDLTIKKDVPQTTPKEEKSDTDILPLDKLTLPVKKVSKVDRVALKYQESMLDAIGQLERIKEVLDGDKSFKNFIALLLSPSTKIRLLSIVFIPAIISDIINCGSSLLGLSDVTTTLSDNSSAIFPILGRFVVSLSPPQPNKHINLPSSGVISLADFNTFSNPSGVWA